MDDPYKTQFPFGENGPQENNTSKSFKFQIPEKKIEPEPQRKGGLIIGASLMVKITGIGIVILSLIIVAFMLNTVAGIYIK